jgi:hypothetical protein
MNGGKPTAFKKLRETMKWLKVSQVGIGFNDLDKNKFKVLEPKVKWNVNYR